MNSRLMMTINEVSFNRPKVVAGFGVIFCCCWLRPIQVSLKFFSEIFTPCKLMLPRSNGNMKCSPFLDVIISFASSLRSWVSDGSSFPSSSTSATKISPFQIPPAPHRNAYPRIPGTGPSHHSGGALTGPSRTSERIQPLLPTKRSVLSVVLRIVSHKVFSHLPRGLEHVADSNTYTEPRASNATHSAQ